MEKTKKSAYGNPERGDVARKKLIEAALEAISETGYEGASTRAIAASAGVNIAAIPYYFGSKEGLYLAVIDYILKYYQDGLGGSLASIRAALAEPATTRARCRALLDNHMRVLISFILQEGAERSRISHLYIRESLDPTPAFDRLYDGFIRDMQATLTALVARIVDPDLPPAQTKLVTQTLLGQIAFFKSSREAILHDMGWDTYGKTGMVEIERVIMRNVAAVVAAYQDIGAAP